MLSNRPPGKGLLSEPFSWIILGAALVFASSILSGALGIVYVFAEFNPAATFPGDLFLAVSVGLVPSLGGSRPSSPSPLLPRHGAPSP